jgi:hypothetical protein
MLGLWMIEVFIGLFLLMSATYLVKLSLLRAWRALAPRLPVRLPRRREEPVPVDAGPGGEQIPETAQPVAAAV